MALRSVEYVKTKDECPKTERLRRQDISFKFIGNKNHLMASRKDADHVLFTFRQQKNGIRNQIVSRPRNELSKKRDSLCPVLIAASLVERLDSYMLDNPYINTVKIENTFHTITYNELIQFQRSIGSQLGKETIGFNPSKIGTHSMRVTFATFLYNQGLSDTIIMTEGRWQSTAFLKYIRSNTSQDSYNVTKAISSMNNFSFILK